MEREREGERERDTHIHLRRGEHRRQPSAAGERRPGIFIGWSNNHFNNLPFRSLLETNE